MAKVLACSEYEDVNSKDYLYYESIRPEFVKRRHDLQFTTWIHVWEVLAKTNVDILLMFVRRKQSRCWEVAYHVYNEWHLPHPAPFVLMIIERSPSEDLDFNQPAHLDNASYAKWYYGQEPAYFQKEEPYNKLFHNYVRTFNRRPRAIVNRVEGLFMAKWFNRAWFEDQIAALYPGPRERWTYTVAREAYHPIMDLRLNEPKPEQAFPVVLSSLGKFWVVDSWDKFQQFISDEQLNLGEEPDREDILFTFSMFQQRRIIRQIYQPDKMDIPLAEKVLLSKYAETVSKPTCALIQGEWRVRLWVIDEANNNLEEWLFTQRGTNLHVQSWIREKDFQGQLKECESKTLGYMTTYGIPPSFLPDNV